MGAASGRNARLSAARGWLHGQTCRSDFCREDGDNDHARRTQHGAARALVDATTDRERAAVLHTSFCLAAMTQRDGCPMTERHIENALDRILPQLPKEIFP